MTGSVSPPAPLLIFVTARKTFSKNAKPNRHAPFDAGAAWMSLALQARKLGLHAHAMAGFDRENAHDILGLPEEEFDIIAAVAVGRRVEPDKLPEDLAAGEAPNDRKPLSEVAFATKRPITTSSSPGGRRGSRSTPPTSSVSS
jgi:nitroreductase